MIRQARTGDKVLFRSREMTLPWWPGGERGKDDRKHNTAAPLLKTINLLRQHPQGLMKKVQNVNLNISKVMYAEMN
jgi:hypothetical protein